MILLIESQLFPCVDFFKLLIQNTYVKLEQYETFQKMSFRNRYVVVGANGKQNLTIPVVGGRNQRTLMKDVEIDFSEDWQTRHWRSIVAAYSKSPFFDYYSKEIEALLITKEVKLVNFNLIILDRLCKLLRIKVVIELTEVYSTDYNSKEDYRNKLLPKNFQEKGVDWLPKYSQVFEDRLGFQPNLSIIDLLFCEGPNALQKIEQSLK